MIASAQHIKKISSDDVWNHLSKFYDLQALNESEIIPFPNKSGYFDVLESEVSDLCEKNFPRTSYINTQPTTETVKSDGSSKSATKPVKPEPKTALQMPKTDIKPETKPISIKNDGHANTLFNKGDYQKTNPNNNSKSSQQQPATPSSLEPSPKRTKRTRNVPSAGTSPATPTEPASKRRR